MADAAARKPRLRPRKTGERALSLAVLAVLCAVAGGMLAVRGNLNPAVVVALRAPNPSLGIKGAAPAEATANQSAAALAAAADAAAADAAAEAGATPESPQAAAKTAVSLASLLPDAAPGAQPLSKPESFTPATLSDKIDGKAELYLAAGFVGMACRSYQAGPARVELYLYRMKSPDAAFAAFSGQRRPGAAQSPLAKNAYLTENALFLISGNDYLEVIADRAGAKAPLEALAGALLTKLGAGKTAAAGAPAAGANAGTDAKPAAATDLAPPDLFPTPGLKADSIRLAVADAFGCQGLTNMYTAEYDAALGGAANFLSRRKSPAEARGQLALYQRFLTENGYAPQASANAPAGAVVLVMDGSVEVLFVRGSFLAGVHDAPSLAVALKFAAELNNSLKSKGLEK